MTDPTTPRRTPPATPLEPWALELLDAESTPPDAPERAELERLVALLRNLEDPAEDPERVERVMEALAARRDRSTVVRAAFGSVRRIVPPPLALALAAGVAGLLAIAVAPGNLPFLAPPTGEEAPARVVAEASPPAERRVPLRRRTTPVIRPQLVNVSALSASSPTVTPGAHYDSAYHRSLDRQLNQLMIDPDAFARRLEGIAQRDRFIARLANRAAERGDAPEIALRVRQSRHPLAAQLVDRLLRSNLVASVSPR